MRDHKRNSLPVHSPEAGQALVLFVAGLVAFIGIVGLSIDVGHKMWARTDQQKAADAAAIAAVNHYLDTGNKAAAKAAGESYAADNGYSGSQVTVTWGPATGPNANNAEAVEVIIEKPLSKYFIGLVYPGEWKAKARAVAKQTVVQHGFGVITLDPAQCKSLMMDSNAEINVTGGGVFVNSGCVPNAMHQDSNSSVAATMVNVHGEHQGLANAHTTPAPIEHGMVVPDPFATVPLPPKVLANHALNIVGPQGDPVPANADAQCNTPGAPQTYSGGNKNQANKWYTFHPGRYQCAITFDSNAGVVFMPGNYFFDRGIHFKSNTVAILGQGVYYFGNLRPMENGAVYGLWMSSNNVLAEWDTYPGTKPANANASLGKGVLLYGGCAAACGSSGRIELQSNTDIKLTPYGGQYMNLLIWQDRQSPTEMILNSNAHVSPGAVYAANATLHFDSNATAASQFVVRNLDMNSNARIDVNITNSTKVEVKSYAFVE
jgi:Putative Flp pilus-assembly TadE/G-like